MPLTLSQTRTMRNAIDGDNPARHEVAMACLQLGRKRLAGYYSKDQAITRDDLAVTFYEAVLKNCYKAKMNVGDPYQFLVQCGIWAVASEVARVKLVEGLDTVGAGSDEDAGFNGHRFQDEADTELEAISQVHAERTVTALLAIEGLSDYERRYITAVLEEKLDPNENGANQQFAVMIGVCPQRASQITAKLRKRAAAFA